MHRHRLEGRQNDTQNAVSFIEAGVKDVDASLRLAEEAPSENVQLLQVEQQRPVKCCLSRLRKRSQRMQPAFE